MKRTIFRITPAVLLCAFSAVADRGTNSAVDDLVRALNEPELRLLVEDVLERHPRLAVLEADARAAALRAPQVRALPDPTASLTLYLLEPQTRVGPQQAAASVSQRLPWFGKLHLKEQAALLDAAAVASHVDGLRLNLVTKTRTLYLELRFLDDEERIVAADRTTLEHYEELARARYASGVGIGQAVIKIQAEITKAQTRLVDIRERRASLEAQINALRDRPPNTPVILGDAPMDHGAAPAFDDLTERALASRPEVAEVQAHIDAAVVRVEISQMQSRPDFSVGLSYALVGGRDDHSGRLNPPEGNGDDILSLTGGVTLPVWNEKFEAGVEETVQRRLAAGQEKRALAVEIEGEIAEIERRLPLIKERLTLFDEVLTVQAEEALNSAETAYASGTASALDLLDAERFLLGVRIAAERARTDLAVASVRLEGVVATPLSTVNNPGVPDAS